MSFNQMQRVPHISAHWGGRVHTTKAQRPKGCTAEHNVVGLAFLTKAKNRHLFEITPSGPTWSVAVHWHAYKCSPRVEFRVLSLSSRGIVSVVVPLASVSSTFSQSWLAWSGRFQTDETLNSAPGVTLVHSIPIRLGWKNCARCVIGPSEHQCVLGISFWELISGSMHFFGTSMELQL